MIKKSHPTSLYKAYLDYFLAQGIEKIPYEYNEMHMAFFDELKQDADLATQWKLVKEGANPHCGTLDEMIQRFHMCGITSFDKLDFPKHILVLNISRYKGLPQPSEKEVEIATKIGDNFKKLIK